MRHRKAGRRLVRTSEQRLALMRSLVTALVRHERIKTTDARAKELRKLADKMVTLGKRGDLHARRQAARYIQNGELLAKLFDEIAPRFSQRAGGYTRVLKLGNRKGDNAPVSIIEYLTEDRVVTPAEEEAAAE